MTQFQVIALSILGIVGFVQFILPSIKLPKLPVSAEKPDTLRHIAQVIAIRDSSSDPKVVEACKALLQTLI